MEYITVAAALIVGFLTAWLIQLRKQSKADIIYNENVKKLMTEKSESEKENLVVQETLRLKTEELSKNHEISAQQLEIANARSLEIEKLKAINENINEKLQTQKTEIEALQKRLTTEFENIATRILKERSDDFSNVNQKQIGELLNPLRDRIKDFEKKVDEAYDKELRDKISLREEVKKLTELNTRVSEEANNLTKALKGDVKKQGNWGEVVLERVLERSGLTKGQEYEREEVVEGADEKIQRPDVIIHLPDNKHIIIDSKVSLVAYDRFVSDDDEDKKQSYLKEHLASLRNHVKLLSDKNYQKAQNINTPDFVLMFIPIEGSFSVAVQADGDLFSYAWERKIVIVSPTTLLATLRTVSSIWKQENQTKNAKDIARESGALYDKFCNFIEDLKNLGKQLDKAKDDYKEAMKKLYESPRKGDTILGRIERIKELGANTTKSLPQALIDRIE